MGRARILTGFHRIQVEISPNRWVSVADHIFYFGKRHVDNAEEALKKANAVLEKDQQADPEGKYRIQTYGNLQ